MVESLLCILRSFETNEPKLLGLHLVIFHDAYRVDLTKVSEGSAKLLFSEVKLREVFDVEVGGAARFSST